jgi:hypothetical protein
MTKTQNAPGNCPPCDRHWHGLTEAHCAGCHQHFSSVTAFDAHQPRPGGCPDPGSLRDGSGNPLLRLADRASGPTWVVWASEENLAAMRERFAARKAR